MTSEDVRYQVRYKARIEHRDLKEHDLVELVRSGQVSGVHAYCASGQDLWHPVFRMEYKQDKTGHWKIIDAVRPAKPVKPDRKPKQEPAAPAPAPQIAPSVVIYPQAPQPPAPHSTPAPAPDAAQPRRGNGLAITGFVVGVAGLVAGLSLLIPVMFREYTGIGGELLAILAVVFSGCAMASPRRRALSIAGLSMGIVAMIGWGAFIAFVMLRSHAR